MNLAGKKIKVVVNGVPYEVEIGDLGSSSLNVIVNGKPYVVEWEVSPPVSAQSEQKAPPVSAPTPAAQPAPAAKTVTAPMPGNIMDVQVKVGDKVQAGQPLCYLEAMKMKNVIRATAEGAIASVEVSEGQVVDYGALLFTFE
jgi:biotin carboxyl carrier protein